jgi:predicted nuclease with TOPRIM domain
MVKLNTEVIELKVANKNLMNERTKLKDSLQYVWDEMDRITHVEQLLIDENRILEDEIEKLKPKYEQIKRSVPRLTADSIRRYFANL